VPAPQIGRPLYPTPSSKVRPCYPRIDFGGLVHSHCDLKDVILREPRATPTYPRRPHDNNGWLKGLQFLQQTVLPTLAHPGAREPPTTVGVVTIAHRWGAAPFLYQRLPPVAFNPHN